MSKIKILVWSDSATSTTGFGTVSMHIMKALHNTGKYDIDQLAINFFNKFYDREKYPYTILPARLENPKDPYGSQMFTNILQENDYDLVFIINDTFVVEQVAQVIDKIKEQKRSQNKKVFKLIYYYPIDCKFMPFAATMTKVADCAVAYTYFAKEETQKILGKEFIPEIIYHGCDTNNFFTISNEERKAWRRQVFGITSDDTFLWINVNRNSIRKDIARSILAFKEFRKTVPNSKMYVHSKVQDGTQGVVFNLSIVLSELGLDMQNDVIFPNQEKYSVANGYPIDTLNKLYNCADAYLTTTLGEGFGLTITDAMTAGVPVVAGEHTSVPEILGTREERGYIYKCEEKVFIDNSGLRPLGRLDKIVGKMKEVYKDKKSNHEKFHKKIYLAKEFAKEYSWENICKQWVDLFDKVYKDNKTTLVKKENNGEIL